MKQFLYSRSRIIEALIHIIGWGIVFAFPFVMMTRSGFTITWVEYLRHGSIVPLSFLIVFYGNYCFLIPRYLFEGRIRQYLLLNVLLIVCVTAGVHFWQEYAFHAYAKVEDEGRRYMGPPKWIFIMRDFFSMILTVGLSAAIRLSGRWVQVEAARREAEKSRTEAELKNLRNQLNPHFLLNTLNNIYALIAFDTDKAQTAVQELSRLLRPVLRRLLPQAGRDEETLAALSANVSANLLGLGNAATPAGIQAAKRMAVGCGGTASDELCRLVVLNTASVQLLPSTVAALRGGLGSAAPLDILPAVWLSSALSVTAGLACARVLGRVWRT